MLNRRRAGVLCHLTSLPMPGLGGDALRFLDFLERAGLTVWQMLPLNPPDDYGSPFRSVSLFAASEALAIGAASSSTTAMQPTALARFRADQGDWLQDYALYRALRAQRGSKWSRWPRALKGREPAVVAAGYRKHAPQIEAIVSAQAQVAECLRRLRAEAHARGILLFGDLPMFPAHDSADVWAHPDLFQLDERSEPRAVAGVPPDDFAPHGQLWGNPLYAWEAHRETDFAWWRRRIAVQAGLFDVLRLDHFRGLDACWAVPRGARVADGRWEPAPGRELLTRLVQDGRLSTLVAEDLGVITPDVNALRDEFALPGMRVLQFAFNGDLGNPHLPEHHPRHAVAYTGTHDTNTTLGWYRALDKDTRLRVVEHLGESDQPVWRLIETAFGSQANTAMIPLQDFLQLGSAHRMNTPGRARGNWAWQFDWDQLDDALAARIRALIVATRR